MKLPDHDQHMGEVKDLAGEARGQPELERALNTLLGDKKPPQNPGTVAPIFMGKDHETIPDRYVLHWSETTCRNCGHVETSSDFFALSYIRSRVGGTRIRHLVKTQSPLYNLPVDRIKTGSHGVPYCTACPPIDLSHLPPPPEPSQLRDLPEPQLKNGLRKTAERQSKDPKPAKKPPSLDDLV